MPTDALYKSIFGDEEDPDYESLKRRRAIAAALMTQKSTAQHPLTRGMEELGLGIGSLIGQMRLRQMEKAQKARDLASRGTPGQTHTVAPQPPAPPQAPQAPAAPQAPGRPLTQINPVQHQQTSQVVPPDVEEYTQDQFNPIDAAAPDVPSTAFAGRFDQSYTPTNEPIANDPAQQMTTMAPDPVVNPPVDPRAPVPGPNWPPAPPAEPVRDINAFAPAAAPIERAAAPAAAAGVRIPPPHIKALIDAKVPEAERPYYYQLAYKESTFNPELVSKTGATGLFQHTTGSGQRYGLIGKGFDVRKDPEANLDATIAYTRDSDKVLTQAGLPANFSNRAILHQQGHTGGLKLLSGQPTSPRNLAVNRIDPRSEPLQAVAKINSFYQMPDGPGGGTAVAGGATPYRDVAVRPEADPRAEIAELAALNPQMLAEQGSPNLQGMQTVQAPDPERGSRQMIAEALAGQQRPQGVQVASMGDPARQGISMPRAEPMGSLPLMQSRNQPVPPRPPPGSQGIPDPNNPGSFLSPDVLGMNPSGMPDMSGMDVPSMEGPAPDPMGFMDPSAFPFNPSPAPPAAGGDPNAGAPIPAAPPTPAAVPAPPEQAAPVRMAQAQLAPGIRPDATGSPFPPPPPPPDTSQGIQPAPQEVQAPGVLPSGQPIPPVSTAEYPDPGPLPEDAKPRRIGPSRDQLHYQRNMNDERLSDRERKRNEQLFNAEEQARREIQTIEIERAKNEREKWEAKVKGKFEFELKRDERVQQEAQRRLAIEEAQQKALTAPIERKLKELDLRIKSATEPDEIEKLKIQRQQAQATLDETLQKVELGKKPPHMTFGKTILEWNKDTKSWRDVTPGTNIGNIEVTEAQAKKLQFFERAYVARRQGGDYSAMAGLVDSATGKIPIGGNYWTSREYQLQNSASEVWIESVLRDVSGAVIRVEEYPQYKKMYFPQPGDERNPQLLKDKAERRANVERSFYDGLGTAKPIADKFVADEKAKDDKAAIDWARSHPSDPRAIEIMRRQGVQ